MFSIFLKRHAVLWQPDLRVSHRNRKEDLRVWEADFGFGSSRRSFEWSEGQLRHTRGAGVSPVELVWCDFRRGWPTFGPESIVIRSQLLAARRLSGFESARGARMLGPGGSSCSAGSCGKPQVRMPWTPWTPWHFECLAERFWSRVELISRGSEPNFDACCKASEAQTPRISLMVNQRFWGRESRQVLGHLQPPQIAMEDRP